MVKSGSGHTIVPDKNKFLQERYKRGDGQGSAMYPLLYYFVRTQLLDDYMNARVQERLQKLKPNPQSDMLFQCIEYIDKHQIAISPFDVKRIVKQMNQSLNSPKRQLLLKNEALRNVTLALTSTRPYEGNASEDVSKLCDTCRITTTKCVDVLDIIWMRLRYIRTQWKAALQALYLLRSLLLHGPLTTMSEALWGLEKIRALKQYQTSNRANALQIQNAAKQVCALLVDRSHLLMLRRAYAARKHVVKSGKVPTLEKIHALRKAPSFLDMHKYLRPKIYPATYTSINRTANDLLDFSARSSPPNSNTDINANVNANAYTRTAIGGYGSDLLTASFTAATNSSVQNSNNSDNNGDPFHGTTASAATTTASSTMTVHPTKNALEQIFGSATTQTNPNPNTNTNANTNTNTQQANPFDVNSPPASGPAPTPTLAPALALAIPVSTAAKPPPPRPTATTSNITLSSVPAPASDPLDIFGPVTSKVSDPFDNTPMKATPISAASLSSFAQPDNPFVTTTTTTSSSSSSSTTTPASNTNVFDVGSLVKATPVVNPPSVSLQQQQQQQPQPQPQQFANPFTNAQGIPQSPYAMAPSHSHPLPPQQQQPSRYPLSSPPPQQLQQQQQQQRQQQQQPPRAYSSNQYGNVAPPMGAAPRYYPPHAPNPNQPQPYPYQPQQRPHLHLHPHPHPQQSRGQQQPHPSSLSSSQQYNPYQQISQNNRSQFKNLPP